MIEMAMSGFNIYCNITILIIIYKIYELILLKETFDLHIFKFTENSVEIGNFTIFDKRMILEIMIFIWIVLGFIFFIKTLWIYLTIIMLINAIFFVFLPMEYNKRFKILFILGNLLYLYMLVSIYLLSSVKVF